MNLQPTKLEGNLIEPMLINDKSEFFLDDENMDNKEIIRKMINASSQLVVSEKLREFDKSLDFRHIDN